MLRIPAVAGSFYPSSPQKLKGLIEECFKTDLGPGYIPQFNFGKPGPLLGLVVPHAGYVYSGPVAAHSYAKLAENGFEWLMLFGPNHTGVGEDFAGYLHGFWRTPLGDLPIAEEKIALFSETELVDDPTAHLSEHSIEVQLPFLQYFQPNFSFLPVCVSTDDLLSIKRFGQKVGEALKEEDGAVIIASTDLSHYLPQREAERRDRIALESICDLDSDALWRAVRGVPITMCGYGPVIILIEAALKLGVRKVELLKYATSGDTSGNYFQVVGYGALAFWR